MLRCIVTGTDPGKDVYDVFFRSTRSRQKSLLSSTLESEGRVPNLFFHDLVLPTIVCLRYKSGPLEGPPLNLSPLTNTSSTRRLSVPAIVWVILGITRNLFLAPVRVVPGPS